MDFIILHELFSSRNPDFAYDSYDRFHLDNMNDDECKAEFRVRKRNLPTSSWDSTLISFFSEERCRWYGRPLYALEATCISL